MIEYLFSGIPNSGQICEIGHSGLFFAQHRATIIGESMTPFFYPARNNWRVQIPASETETGKRTSRFFPTKEEAEEFVQEHYKAGSVQLAELSLHEKHVLGVMRQSSDYTPDLLLDAWRDYRARQRTRSYFSVTQLCQGLPKHNHYMNLLNGRSACFLPLSKVQDSLSSLRFSRNLVVRPEFGGRDW